jgi:peptide/nickel transport system ATP-binding protein
MSDMMARPVVSIKQLAVHFGNGSTPIKALEDVSLDLIPGRVMGIVGESGCGKSVTARAVLRILDGGGRIERGQILLDPFTSNEVDLAKLDASSERMRGIRGKRIGLIFQEPMTALSNYYTVGNQIEEAVRHAGHFSRRAARDRMVELLTDVGIPRPESRIDVYPFQLSGGLRQRIGIALALAGDPDVLIADEPTTALDVTTQAQILRLLQRLQTDKRIALMLITHDMGVIAEMADDVAVMYLGRIAERAPVTELFENPQHPYTRALLKSMPNIHAKPRERLATIGGAVPSSLARPSGCPFHPRCPEMIGGRCAAELPPPVPASHPGASCWLVEKQQ